MRKVSNTISETRRVAAGLAQKITKRNAISFSGAVVIGLAGDLGAGKTVFAQGFAKALGIKERVTSPTFIVMKKFEIRSTKSETNSKSKIQKFKTLIHIDAYRINSPKELLVLGWEDLINDPKNIILIEWADKIKKILPKKYFLVEFKHVREKERQINLRYCKT